MNIKIIFTFIQFLKYLREYSTIGIKDWAFDSKDGETEKYY